MDRIDWNQYFMYQAEIISLRATCERLKVGAVIVRENRIVSSGYNGSVSDSTHCIDEGCKVVNNHCVRTVHAEANAILQCAKFGVPMQNTTLYVTHFPCLQCTKQIIQAGVKRIYYKADYRNDTIAMELLEEAQITVEKVELSHLRIDENYLERDALMLELLEAVKNNPSDEAYVAELTNRVQLLTK